MALICRFKKIEHNFILAKLWPVDPPLLKMCENKAMAVDLNMGLFHTRCEEIIRCSRRQLYIEFFTQRHLRCLYGDVLWVMCE